MLQSQFKVQNLLTDTVLVGKHFPRSLYRSSFVIVVWCVILCGIAS
jgi:ABC-type uncharacterized transport system permease subunit